MNDFTLKVLTTLLMFFLTHLPFSNGGMEIETDTQDLKRFIWVDSVLAEMTPREKIGQMLMLRGHTNRGDAHISALKRQVRDLNPGGVCLFQGTGPAHKALIKELQELSEIPLLVSMDAEWGLNMRLKEFAPFPKQMSLGAINDPSLLRDMGLLIAEECRSIGVNFNFAPVVDVNNNPDNPVINYRSFGEDPRRVGALAEELYLGMAQGGMMACAKHFPGHGDTRVDSHKDLPVIPKSYEQLKETELRPFRKLSLSNVPAIMTAHLHLPLIDSTQHLPASLSPIVVNDILRDSMNFRGLVVTDALEMQGVRKHFDNKEIALMAFKAGTHILLLPERPYEAMNALEEALKNGSISIEDVNQRVARILWYKHQFVIDPTLPIKSTIPLPDRKAKLFRKLANNSVCLLKNQGNILPLHSAKQNIHHLALGTTIDNAFSKRLTRITELASRSNKLDLNEFRFKEVSKNILDKEDLFIVSIHPENQKPSNNYGITAKLIRQLEELDEHCELLIVYFGNAYGLSRLAHFDNLVFGQEPLDCYLRATANAIFGYAAFKGILPVSIGEDLVAGSGYTLDKQYQLEYTVPAHVSMRQQQLDSITELMQEGIRAGAYPSAVVLVARDGKIVYHHAEGYTDYSGHTPVHKNSMYDLASITKVAATGICLMKLVDAGRLSLDQELGDVLPEARGTNKQHIRIRDILQHRAGLKPWIPFYERTISRKKWNRVLPDPIYYSAEPIDGYCSPVDGRLFLRDDYQDSIYQQVWDSELLDHTDYVYSDLGFILMRKVIEKLTEMPFDAFFNQRIARPLQLHHLCFNPLDRGVDLPIPPTEEDDYFRCSRVQGHVHDMAAAMLGGVSGHAGLFGNAYDLATVFQVLLNGGRLGEQQFLSDTVISTFTRRYADTRRGLCFDMKQLSASKKQNIHPLASDKCFGHFGFTGTAVWADPECDLIYVFLSNRTYPDMDNQKINRMNIRNRIQGLIYRSMTDGYET